MMRDPIDDILSSDVSATPSPGFQADVMREVYRIADEPQPLRFPWARFLPGCVAMLVLVAVSVGVVLSPASSLAATLAAVSRWGDAEVVGSGLIWGLLGAFISYVSVRLSLQVSA